MALSLSLSLSLALSLAPPPPPPPPPPPSVAATAATACSSSTSLFLRAAALTTMSSPRRRRPRMRLVVAMADLLGDLGARDPFPEEIESKFGEKVLGNVDTLHQILIPTLSALSLARLPLQPDAAPLSLDDARRLLLKVVGWRLVVEQEQQRPARLQCVWKVRDEPCAQELIARINAALDGAGHAPAALQVLVEAPGHEQQVVVHQVRAELSAAGDCLTVNDFIVAARIDKVKTLDLIPKKRVWA